jgi:hypothetical protein
VFIFLALFMPHTVNSPADDFDGRADTADIVVSGPSGVNACINFYGINAGNERHSIALLLKEILEEYSGQT